VSTLPCSATSFSPTLLTASAIQQIARDVYDYAQRVRWMGTPLPPTGSTTSAAMDAVVTAAMKLLKSALALSDWATSMTSAPAVLRGLIDLCASVQTIDLSWSVSSGRLATVTTSAGSATSAGGVAPLAAAGAAMFLLFKLVR
jgi:hypothetical protein